MKAYHGTDQDFKKLDVNKTSEYGLYFGIEKEVAESYGINIHEVTLNYNNLCDLTKESGVKKAIEILPETFMTIIDEQDLDTELTINELLEDEFEACLSVLSDSSVNLENGKCLRDEILKALEKTGYDAVLLNDYTDGDEHAAYVIFDNVNYKYI